MVTWGLPPADPMGSFILTRDFLSHFEILLNGVQPLLLGSNVRDDNSSLTVDLTNPDMYFENISSCPRILCI